MSFETHLASLEQKHLALDHELSTILNQPKPENDMVIEIKRKKLKLKDKIQRLRSSIETN